MTAIEEKPGKARPGLIRRSAALCAASLSGLLLLVIILGAGVYLRLASGEISLNAYLPEITSRISERLPGARIEIASAAVALTERVDRLVRQGRQRHLLLRHGTADLVRRVFRTTDGEETSLTAREVAVLRFLAEQS